MSDPPLATWLGEASDTDPEAGHDHSDDDDRNRSGGRGWTGVRVAMPLAVAVWGAVALVVAVRVIGGEGTDVAPVVQELGSSTHSTPGDAQEQHALAGTTPGPAPGRAERPEALATPRTGLAQHADRDLAHQLVTDAGADLAARAAAALAASAVHEHVTASGSDDHGVDWYVDHVVAEQVRMLGDVAVVTVLASVLEGSAGVWHERRTARFGIAMAVRGDGLRPVSQPWPLPPPDLSIDAAPPGMPVEDTDAHDAALEALEAAGYTDVELRVLTRHPFGVLVAELDGLGPDDRIQQRLGVWLTDERTPTVLGHADTRQAPTEEGQE